MIKDWIFNVLLVSTFLLGLHIQADDFFEIETIRFYKRPKKSDFIQYKSEEPSLRLDKKHPPYFKVDVKIKEQQSSKGIFAKIYYYNDLKVLLTQDNLPIAVKRSGGYSSFPAIFRKQKTEELYFILPESLKRIKFDSALVVFGDKQSATAKVYPKGNVSDFEFKEKDLVTNGKNVIRSIFVDPIIEYQFRTGNPKQPLMTFFMRLPLGINNMSEVKGVLAMSLLANSVSDMRRRLQDIQSKDDVGGLLKFAQDNKLIIICWGSRSLWNPRKSWDEQTRKINKNLDRLFDDIADDWEKGIKYFIRRYKIPENGYLLWGASGSAQYAARLALRKPEYFSAIHIHIPSSFDVPTPKANRILWCLTTGENEIGYRRSLRFFEACKKLKYPIIYKAIPGLAHQGHPQANLLGYRFFEYVIKLKKQIKNSYRAPYFQQKKEAVSIRTFNNPIYIGDLLNQQIISPDLAMILVPEKYQVPLPTKELADAWKGK